MESFFFDNKDKIQNDRNAETVENYGFKSRKCPPQIKDMIPFENDLHQLIKKIEFRRVNNKFQSTLKKDLQEIKKSPNLFVFADKTRNIYEMSKDSYV